MAFFRGVSWQRSMREIGPYLAVGMQFAFTIVICVFGGLWLDKKIHTTPLFLILGFFLGAVSGFWSLYKSIYLRKRSREKSESETGDP